MRIEREDQSSVGAVWAVFTRGEAAELLAALQHYFEEEPPDPGWHSHFGEGELTIAVEITT